jgi:hypothetical protein
MRTRKELSDKATAAIEKMGPGNELAAIMVLLTVQIEVLADIRELLTYDKGSGPYADSSRVFNDIAKVRERGEI